VGAPGRSALAVAARLEAFIAGAVNSLKLGAATVEVTGGRIEVGAFEPAEPAIRVTPAGSRAEPGAFGALVATVFDAGNGGAAATIAAPAPGAARRGCSGPSAGIGF
jgi:hypothetical protein